MTLAAKLSAVMAAIDVVEKKGSNEAQGYAFVRATDVARDVRAELVKQKVAFLLDIASVGMTVHERSGKSPFFLTTVEGRAIFIDAEDGAELAFGFAGTGGDYGGDKGLYKAITGGLKYALLTAFLIPNVADDPEVDQKDPDDRLTAAPTGAAITVLGAAVAPDDSKLANDRQKAHLRATAREKGLDGDAFKAFVKAITNKGSSKDLTVGDYNDVLSWLTGASPEHQELIKFYHVWSESEPAPAAVAPVA